MITPISFSHFRKYWTTLLKIISAPHESDVPDIKLKVKYFKSHWGGVVSKKICRTE